MPATEETYRPQRTLHVVFAVSSIAMLLVIVWMIMADHLRPWKEVQREFHKIETDKLAQVKKAKQEEERNKLRAELDAVKNQIKKADEIESKNARVIADKEDELRKVRGEFTRLDTDKKFQKAELDSQRSFYAGMIDLDHKVEARHYLKNVIDPSEKTLADLTLKYEKAADDLRKLEQEIEGLRGNKAALVKKKEDLERGVFQANRTLTQREEQYGEGSTVNAVLAWMRGLPGIDMAASPTKIQQISLPDLTIDYNFKNVPRYDRCTTCHLGIDRVGYDKDADGRPMPRVFASHPHLTDGATAINPQGQRVKAGLYLDSNGPHKINNFGCTICHGGQGSGTSFTYASHEPNTLAEEHRWREEYGWEEIHHWDFPMLPDRYIQSSCVKCHHQVTDIPRDDAPRLRKGYDQIVKYGCTGCHTIGGEGSIGPNLSDARKVGPNLEHVAYKVSADWLAKWIKNPHAFRPDTRMPRFYGLTNNNGKDDWPKNHAEIQAIAHYLIKKSTPPPGFVDPPAKGDPARGKDLFLQKGCMACHEHRIYQEKDLPASLVGHDTKVKPGADLDKTYDPSQFPEAARPFAEANFGPNLANVAAKFQSIEPNGQGYRWLVNWIKAPESYHPKSLMPNLQLSWQEAADIASWIITIPGDWAIDVSVPTVDSREVRTAIHELVRLYKGKTEPLSQLDAIVGGMSTDDQLMYLGEKTISRLGCFGCHDIPGFETAKKIGTPLDGWGSKSPTKLDFGHIIEYMTANPHDGTDGYYKEKLVGHTRPGFLYQKVHRPRSYDFEYTKEELKAWDERLRMPQFAWADDPEAIEDVMNFVLGLTGEKIPAQYLPNPSPARNALALGEKLVERYNCKGCHVLAMPRYTIAEGTKVAEAMPDFDANVTVSAGPLGRGLDYLKELYPDLTYTRDKAPELTPDDGKTRVTIEGMPTRLDEDDAGNAVLQNVQIWKPVTIRGYTFSVGDNVVIHTKKVDVTPAEGGNYAWLYATTQAQKTGNNFGDFWNRLPPPLIREGSKVQTPWLTLFLKDPYPIRPAVNLRMPRFHFDQSHEETTELANFFAARDDVEFPYQDIPERERSYLAQLEEKHHDYLGAGWQVMTGNGSACVSCHAIGNFKPTGGADVVNGPDLRQVNGRFRSRYLAEWLARPSRLVPYTAMPQNIPPDGAPGVPIPPTFGNDRFAAILAVRDTLLNYLTAIEGQLARSGPFAPEPAKPPGPGSGGQ